MHEVPKTGDPFPDGGEQSTPEEETMKVATLAIATALFTASAAADHVYHGFAQGDGDLYSYGTGDADVTGMQPGVGDSVDVYGRFGTGNDDLFATEPRSGNNVADADRALPRVYQGFGPDPDLSW
jgi:hypothetical protein